LVLPGALCWAGEDDPALDPAIAQLVHDVAGVSSPAWDRLTEIAKERGAGPVMRWLAASACPSMQWA